MAVLRFVTSQRLHLIYDPYPCKGNCRMRYPVKTSNRERKADIQPSVRTLCCRGISDDLEGRRCGIFVADEFVPASCISCKVSQPHQAFELADIGEVRNCNTLGRINKSTKLSTTGRGQKGWRSVAVASDCPRKSSVTCTVEGARTSTTKVSDSVLEAG